MMTGLFGFLILFVAFSNFRHKPQMVSLGDSDITEPDVSVPAWKPESLPELNFGVDLSLLGAPMTKGISARWAAGPARFVNTLGPGLGSVNYAAPMGDFPRRFERQAEKYIATAAAPRLIGPLVKD